MTDILVRDSDSLIVERGPDLTAVTGYTVVEDAPANALPGRAWVSGAIAAPPLDAAGLRVRLHEAWAAINHRLINPAWPDVAGDKTKAADSITALRRWAWHTIALADLGIAGEWLDGSGTAVAADKVPPLVDQALWALGPDLVYPLFKDFVTDSGGTRSSWRDVSLAAGDAVYSSIVNQLDALVDRSTGDFTAYYGLQPNALVSGFDPDSPTLGR